MRQGSRGILFIHPGALGDVLLSLPAMRAVRSAFPGRSATILTGGQVGRLLRAGGEVDDCLAIEAGHLASLLAGPASLEEGLRARLHRCDAAVAWMADTDGGLRRGLHDAGVGSVVIGSPFDQGRAGLHQAERYLEIVAAIVPAQSVGWTAHVPPLILPRGRRSAEAGIQTGSGPLVAIHPGSGSRHKCVQPDVLAWVAAKLRDSGRQPILIEGPADAAMVEGVRTRLTFFVAVARGLDVVEMAALLTSVSLFIGQDSGLSHLAALLGVPTIALFGPTDPRRWCPLGPRVRVLRGPPCSCLSWQAVERCDDKPCLQFPGSELWANCLEVLEPSAEPINRYKPLGTDSCHV
jgi:ADP-heptose:LPS heptosyltransferase